MDTTLIREPANQAPTCTRRNLATRYSRPGMRVRISTCRAVVRMPCLHRSRLYSVTLQHTTWRVAWRIDLLACSGAFHTHLDFLQQTLPMRFPLRRPARPRPSAATTLPSSPVIVPPIRPAPPSSPSKPATPRLHKIKRRARRPCRQTACRVAGAGRAGMPG